MDRTVENASGPHGTGSPEPDAPSGQALFVDHATDRNLLDDVACSRSVDCQNCREPAGPLEAVEKGDCEDGEEDRKECTAPTEHPGPHEERNEDHRWCNAQARTDH